MKTLEEVEKLGKNMLSVMDICEYLETDPHVLRETIRKDKKRHTDSLGFPVMVLGNRIKIPREAFVAAMRGAANRPDTVNKVVE